MTGPATSNEHVSVLIIDDDPDHLDLLSRSLREPESGLDSDTFDILTFNDPAKAIANLSTLESTVVICDYNMPGGTGLDWLPDFLRAGNGPVILITGQGDEAIAAEAFREGASDYLTKTEILTEPKSLSSTIRESLRRDRRESCNSALSRQLRIANESLENQNRTLAELTDTAHRFVDNVAHEFRTPLTVIREFAAIIRDGIGGTISDSQREYIEYIIGATGDLAHLVDDFLDSGRLKSRTLRVDRASHPPQHVLEQIRTTLRTRAANKRIEIVEHFESDLPYVFIDLDKAGRTLINLAVNAIKFSPNNERVIIGCAPNGNGDVRFAVTDHGPGMPADEVEVVFERFKQVGDVQRSTIKGFGLGLNIARELVWLNLGSIHVESELGVGSTFSFTVPVFDPAVIVERFLQNIAHLRGDTHVTVLQAGFDAAESSTEQLRARLASICYPTDVVIPAMDGSGVVLIGITNEPDRWIQRLTAALGSRSHVADQPPGEIDIRWVGSWRYPEHEDAITTSAVGRAMAMTTCG